MAAKNGSSFIPMDDSADYIQSLESRLNKLNKKATNELTRRDLIDSLVGAKNLNNHNMLKNSDPIQFQDNDYCDQNLTTKGVVLPEGSSQGVKNLLTKLAPEKLALSPEELVCLIMTDNLPQDEKDKE